MADKFVKLKDLKVYLDIDESNTTHDKKLNMLIEDCTETIKKKLSRDILTNTYTETHSIDPYTITIFTKQYPITTLTSIVENGTTLTANTNYKTNLTKGEIHRIYSTGTEKSWYAGTNTVVITYTAGYSQTNIPEIIQLACKKFVLYEFRHKGGGLKSVSTSGNNIVLEEIVHGMPKSAYDLLRSEMRVR